MSDNQLFDPAEYGVTIRPKRSPRAAEEAVVVRPPWVVLRHLKGSPRAHLDKLGAVNPKRAKEVSVAECGALGMAMHEFDGSPMPACPKCVGIAQKQAKTA